MTGGLTRARAIYFCVFAAFAVLTMCAPASAAPPLAQSHAKFDNEAGCSRCHEPGDNKVKNSKCLSCHLGIGSRVRRGSGFHGKLRGRPCASCHKDHKGRGGNLIRLNKATFDHTKTGWPLQGAHKGVRCDKCHTGTRKGGRVRTYLSAEQACIKCHKNIHGFRRAQLKKCETCHNVFGWRKQNANSTFRHSKAATGYELKGQHAKVRKCGSCHKSKDRFSPLAHADCKDCHKDTHRKLFNKFKCSQCHTEKGFASIRFGHNVPRFKLTGKHKGVRCQRCHTNTNWTPPWNPASTRCNNCHRSDNSHGTQFGDQKCNACHSTKGWKKIRFNHNTQSRFKLVGKHQGVRCKNCHVGGKYKPLDLACKSCHAEDSPHGGNPQFRDKPCENCHTPRDWARVKFDHNSLTKFALSGAHEEVDCEKCHPGADFETKIPGSCDGCHIDLHNGQMQPKLCGNCHTFDAWTIPQFEHNEQSRFSLVGKHMEVDCNECHVAGHFKPIQASCATCHRDFHAGQMQDRICEECHSPLGWQQTSFVHNRDSTYKLRGQHVTIDCKKCHVANNYRGLEKECYDCHTDYHRGEKGTACSDCHTETGWDANTAQVHFFGAYKLAGEHDRIPCDTCHINGRELGGLGHECLNCHKDPHFSSLGPFCVDCHGQNAWLPSKFRHFQTGFRLTGTHRFVRCDQCHINRVYGGLPTDCIFCHQDSAMRYSAAEPGHTCYNGSDCSLCHTTLAFDRVRPIYRNALEECLP